MCRAAILAMCVCGLATAACGTNLKQGLMRGAEHPDERLAFCGALAERADKVAVGHVWSGVLSFIGASAALTFASAYDFGDSDSAPLYRGILSAGGAGLTAAGTYFFARATSASDTSSAAIQALGAPDEIRTKGFLTCANAYAGWIGERSEALTQLRDGLKGATEEGEERALKSSRRWLERRKAQIEKAIEETKPQLATTDVATKAAANARLELLRAEWLLIDLRLAQHDTGDTEAPAKTPAE